MDIYGDAKQEMDLDYMQQWFEDNKKLPNRIVGGKNSHVTERSGEQIKMEVHGDLEQEKAIDYLQQWFENNKELPNKINRILLTRLYYRSSKDIEETIKLVELNYTLRQKNPKIFIDRDPANEDTLNSYAYVDMLPLSGLSPNNHRVTLVRFINSDPNMMHFTEDFKTFIMANDSRFCKPDVEMGNTSVLAEGEVIIGDVKGLSMKHVPRFSFVNMPTIFKFLHQAFPGRIRSVHLINCPSFMDKMLGAMRPFMSKELFEMIKCHTKGLETLFEDIPQEMLPEEYGGNAGNMRDLVDQFKKSILEQRDYLMDPDHWRIQKS